MTDGQGIPDVPGKAELSSERENVAASNYVRADEDARGDLFLLEKRDN